MNFFNKLLLVWLTACLPLLSSAVPYKNFVILIASYNNEQYVEQNILSAFQDYPEEHYRIIFVNDGSKDRTLSMAANIVMHFQKQHLVTIFSNTVRRGALYNHYWAIHQHIKDDEIVVILDGDDQLANEDVLTYLNTMYLCNDIWLTYGQFRHISNNSIGFNQAIPTDIIRNNAFREWTHIPSHLRTFYAKLYKNINLEDLTINGTFLEMCADMAAMLPMIEQARDHFKFIPKVLYLYNDQNPISDHIKSAELQKNIDLHVRSLPAYKPLDKLF